MPTSRRSASRSTSCPSTPTPTPPREIRTPGSSIGDDAMMVIDTQATPVMAQDVIRRIREVTDKPIKYVVLSHYHAVRVLGAAGYAPEHIIASRDTYDLIVERGEADMKSEIERFPRLFRAVESVPGLTWPTIVFEKRLTLYARQAAGRDHAARARSHQGRHGGVASGRAHPVLGRSGRVRRHAVHGRRLSHRLAGNARQHRGAQAREARSGPRRGADESDAGAGPVSTARGHSSRRCSSP